MEETFDFGRSTIGVGESQRSELALACDTTRIWGRICRKERPQHPLWDRSAADRTRLKKSLVGSGSISAVASISSEFAGLIPMKGRTVGGSSLGRHWVLCLTVTHVNAWVSPPEDQRRIHRNIDSLRVYWLTVPTNSGPSNCGSGRASAALRLRITRAAE